MSDDRTALERRQLTNETFSYPRVDYQDTNNYGYGADEGSSRIDLSRCVRGILKRKWSIALLVIFVTSLVTFEMYRRKETYQSYAIVSVGKEDTSLIKYGENDLVIQSDESMKTKLFMLNSTPLIEDVIVDLKLDQHPELLKPEKRTIRETFKSIVDRIHRRPAENPALNVPASSVIPDAQSIPPHQLTAAESWRLEPYVALFDELLSVEAISDTRLIKIKFTHTDPVLAATVSNRLAQFFIQRNFQGKANKFSETSGWLDRTTRELKSRAEKAEQALADYTRAHTIIAPLGKGSLSAEKVTRLQGEVTRAETDRIIKESLYEEAKLGRATLIPEAFADPIISELQKKLSELTLRSAQLDVNYGPENPQTIEVNQQIAALRKQLESSSKTIGEKLKTDFERATRDEGAFKAALEQAKQESAQENQETIQYGVLQQEVETSKSLFRSFLEKSNQARFELAQQENNLRLVEYARVPRQDAGPHRKQWILISMLFSLVLGIGLTILIEYFDQTIQSVDDIDRYLQLPALAAIPTIGPVSRKTLSQKRPDRHIPPGGHHTADTSIIAAPGIPPTEVRPDEAFPAYTVRLDSHSQAAEAYRLLVASLMLSVEINSCKTLLITSSQPGEGKTTTTINAAMSLAQLGKSVLIIDCDLRTPRIHKEIGINSKPGLSEYLSGNAKLNAVIKKLNNHDLSLLPSGSIPERPAELIGSQRMKEMLQALSQRYDHIIIDSPPMISLADPVILSTLVDGVILVVRMGKSNRDAVRRSRQELFHVGGNILGVVLNSVDPQNGKNHNYYSDYARDNDPGDSKKTQ
jgi:polysaccharide biosynthesis transport protein